MAGARYSASGNQNLAAGALTCLTVAANAAIPNRNYIYELIFGNEGTPADHVSLWTVQRCTVLGTNTLVTATKLDMADRIAGALCGENHTVEPTYTANEELLEIPLNHRATFRWVAAPGSEIVTPGTAASGIGVWSLHAAATTLFRAVAVWVE